MSTLTEAMVVCPECNATTTGKGIPFTPRSLGVHRYLKHGVQGQSHERYEAEKQRKANKVKRVTNGWGGHREKKPRQSQVALNYCPSCGTNLHMMERALSVAQITSRMIEQ